MSNKISIEFVAKGHQGVTRAVKALNQQVEKLALANVMLTKGTGNLSDSQKRLYKQLLSTQRGLRNVGKTATGTGTTFSVLRSKMLLASFAAGLVSASLLKVTNMAGAAAEQADKGRVVFGGFFNEMQKWSQEFGESINRSQYQLLEFAAQVQDILVPMGMMRGEASELSKDIVELAVDVGSFSNVATKDVMRDFNSALVGNHETVRKYGVIISEARMKTVAYEQGIIKAGETLTDQQKILARLALIQQDSADAYGNAEDTADSYANVMQGLRDQFEETAIVWGEILMPIVKVFAQLMTGLLKLLERPAGIVLVSGALFFMAKAMWAAKVATIAFRRTLVHARRAIRQFKISMMTLMPIFLLLEAGMALFGKAFPDEEVDDSAQRARNLEKHLRKVREEAGKATYKKATEELEKFEEEVGNLEEKLTALSVIRDDLKKRVPKAEAGDFIPTDTKLILQLQTLIWDIAHDMGFGSKETKKYTKEVKKYTDSSVELNNELKKTKDSIKDVTKQIQDKESEMQIWQGIIDNAKKKTDDYAVAEKKLEREIHNLTEGIKRNQFVMDDWELNTRQLDIGEEAIKRFGVTLEEMGIKEGESQSNLLQLFDLIDDKAVSDASVKLMQRKEALDANTTAEKELLNFKQKNILLDDEQIKKITKLSNEYDELVRSKKAADDIQGQDKQLHMLQKQLDAGRELTQLEQLNAEIEFDRISGTLKYNEDEIANLQYIASEYDHVNKQIEDQVKLQEKLQQEADRKATEIENLDIYKKQLDATGDVLNELILTEFKSREAMEEKRADLQRENELKALNIGLTQHEIDLIIFQEQENREATKTLEDKIKKQEDDAALTEQRNETLKNYLQGINDSIAQLEGRTEAEQKILDLQRQGIELDDDQIANITTLIEKEKALQSVQQNAERILKLKEQISEYNVRDVRKDPSILFETKTFAEREKNINARYGTLLQMQKTHNEKMASLKGDEVWAGEAESELAFLEFKDKLYSDEVQMFREKEEAKQELRQQTVDMGFETAAALTQHYQQELDSQLNDELEALKQSAEYKIASDEKKEKLEQEVKARFQQQQNDIFYAEQTMKVASIAMNTADAIMKVHSQWGWPAGLPIAALMGTFGAIQAGVVMSQKPPVLEQGGLIGGNRHSQGGTLIEAERGEFVMSRNAVESIGLETLNQMNQGQSGGTTINVNLSGNVMTQDFVEGELAESIKEAVRRGSDFGIG